MSLFGEGEYNLNELKEIEVTKDFLELEQNVRACQYKEPIQNCTTRHIINQIEKHCRCKPFNMIHSNKVQ